MLEKIEVPATGDFRALMEAIFCNRRHRTKAEEAALEACPDFLPRPSLKVIRYILSTMSPEIAQVLIWRFGLDGKPVRTGKAISDESGITYTTVIGRTMQGLNIMGRPPYVQYLRGEMEIPHER